MCSTRTSACWRDILDSRLSGTARASKCFPPSVGADTLFMYGGGRNVNGVPHRPTVGRCCDADAKSGRAAPHLLHDVLAQARRSGARRAPPRGPMFCKVRLASARAEGAAKREAGLIGACNARQAASARA